MKRDNLNDEAKAFIDFVGKFLDKINLNTPFEEELKMDIKYIWQEIMWGDLERMIKCNTYIWGKYSKCFIDKNFVAVTEVKLREQGYELNKLTLIGFLSVLFNCLIGSSAGASLKEEICEYIYHKILKSNYAR